MRVESIAAPEPKPMRVLIVLAHPEPTSFNHALAHTAASTLRARGHEVAESRNR